MTRLCGTCSLLFVFGLTWLGFTGAPALAQRVDHPPRVTGGEAARSADGLCDDDEGEDGAERWRGHRRRGRGLFGNPLRPLAQDQGPLQPGEADELMVFARTYVRHVHAALERLRERHPEKFAARMARVAPRLRQLRRLFAENPELAELTVRHIANLDAINRLRKPWNEQPENQPAIEQTIRELLAENVVLETRLLALRLTALRSRGDEPIRADVDALLMPEGDLAAQPGAVRDLVREFRASEDATRQAELREALLRILTEALNERITQMEVRLQEMRENSPAAVDERVEHTLRRFERPEGERRRGWEGRRGPATQPRGKGARGGAAPRDAGG